MTSSLRPLRDWILRVPLVAKLLGANLVIAATAALAAAAPRGAVPAIALAITASVLVNVTLVRLALSPLAKLDQVATRVGHGERYARAVPSAIADEQVTHLGSTLNHLLDELSADHVHMHMLIGRSLTIREAERAAVSHQLREATAQQLAALTFHLAVADSAFSAPAGLTALRTSRDIASRMLGDVRTIADSIYPGLLHELGLPASLEALAARLRARSKIHVTVEAEDVAAHVSPAVVATLYHVAEEGVRNAEQHANARHVWIRLARKDQTIRLDVIDDGCGFSPAAISRTSAGVGLFEARELLAHVHGALQIESIPQRGTHLIATACVDQGDG